jgi:hypothetical protein
MNKQRDASWIFRNVVNSPRSTKIFRAGNRPRSIATIQSRQYRVDVQYTALSKTAFGGGTVTFAPTGAGLTTFTVGTTGVISALVRIQQNSYP